MTESAENKQIAFLDEAGWGDATGDVLAGDASTRRYVRLARSGESALLMVAPPSAESVPCPPEATVEARRALGYNAIARLAGNNLNAFVKVAAVLRSAGLSAPEVYAADFKNGFALIEDLGDDLYAQMVQPNNERELYQAAIDALVHLRMAAPRPPNSTEYRMLNYDMTALLAEAELLIQWYWPHKLSGDAGADAAEEYSAIFSELLSQLSEPETIVLRDYHAENLLWLPQRDKINRVGVIDFQDALFGCAAYDLVSLLEDARRDVAPEFARSMMDYYCEKAHDAPDFEEDRFRRDYAILAAQRNAKILGVFARLANRDGKRRYLDFLPRVENLFRTDLNRDGLAPLRTYFSKRLPELT